MSLPIQTPIRPVLLQVLAELGGRGRPSDVYPLVTKRFPEIRPEDLTDFLSDGRTNRWQNRIQWVRQHLVQIGLIDASERGVWKLTPKGQEMVARGVTAAELQRMVAQMTPKKRSGLATSVAVTEDTITPEVAAPTQTAPLLTEPPQLAALMPVLSESEQLIAELHSAATDSKDPNRLEQVVADIFLYLGFEAEWIGGSGKTDVLVRAPLGIRRYSAVIDAKSSARGKVTDGQVDWLSIRAHRDQERATYACLIGPEFAGGQLTQRAIEFNVTVITTTELAEVIATHAEMPLTLTELRTLLSTVPLASSVLPQLRSVARERRRKRLLISRLLSHIDNFNRAQPDIVLAKPETLLASILGERNPDLLGTTLEDVRRTLLLLETTGVLSAANGDGYVADTSVPGAHRLLGSFLPALEDESRSEGQHRLRKDSHSRL